MIESGKQFNKTISSDYKYGFVTDIENNTVPPGLNDAIIIDISNKKLEPSWLTDWRLEAFHYWQKQTPPIWSKLNYKAINFQNISYYSAPKNINKSDLIDPELLKTYEKLGVPLEERAMLSGIAVDAVFDSVSVATSYKKKLAELGIIFCPFSEAVREYPNLVRNYLGTVVPYKDNFYAALNSAVFSDGSFVYIPSGVRCPVELSTYFRINASNTGQFERTLIIADKNAYVSYLEGCTAPIRDSNQLHAAVVELIAMDSATIKYSTVQNWYPGDHNGQGGIYNFVTKRGLCKGYNSKISWTQVETGSAITWKYPSCILKGDNSVGEFFSIALTRDYQQTDTGTKMIHVGKNTLSTIISKGISAGYSQNTYRGLVRIMANAEGARNHTQCDSLMLSNKCCANTIPTIEVRNSYALVEHEATTSKVSEDQIFYCQQRGINYEDATSLIVKGFCKEIFSNLPMEFLVEAQKLIELKLEGTIG